MAQFAVINGAHVFNIIVADSKEIAEEVTGLVCVETYVGGIGDAYDAETGEFIKPVVEEAPAEEVLPAEETLPAE